MIQQKIKLELSFETKFEIVAHCVACNAYLPHPYWMPKHEFQTPWGELTVGPHENSDFVQSFSNSCLPYARFSPPTNFAESFQEKIFWEGNNYFDKVYWIKLLWNKKKNTIVFSKSLQIESVFRYIFIFWGWWKGRKLQAHCFLQEIIARKTSLHAPT